MPLHLTWVVPFSLPSLPGCTFVPQKVSSGCLISVRTTWKSDLLSEYSAFSYQSLLGHIYLDSAHFRRVCLLRGCRLDVGNVTVRFWPISIIFVHINPHGTFEVSNACPLLNGPRTSFVFKTRRRKNGKLISSWIAGHLISILLHCSFLVVPATGKISRDACFLSWGLRGWLLMNPNRWSTSVMFAKIGPRGHLKGISISTRSRPVGRHILVLLQQYLRDKCKIGSYLSYDTLLYNPGRWLSSSHRKLPQ